MKDKASGWRWRAIALLAIGALIGTTLVASPAGAHFKASISHLATHFYTKSAANNTFVKGQTFLIKLQGGQQRVIATNGPVSLIAQCAANLAGNDRVRIIARTTVDGAALLGDNIYSGAPGNTLDTTTAQDLRVFRSRQVATNSTSVSGVIDRGWVMAPSGKMLSVDTETLALGLNYGGARCILAGVVTKVG